MPLPAPEYAAGAPDPLKGAHLLFTEAGWIYRRSNEILAEAELDPVKVYDLAQHCHYFRQHATPWIGSGDLTAVLAELVRLTRVAGKGNLTKTDAEINEDYKQLYAAAAVFLQWAEANLPKVNELVSNATVRVNRAWPSPDFVVRVPKFPAVTTQVQALRDVFL